MIGAVLKKIFDFLSGKKTISPKVALLVGRDWQEIQMLIKGGTPTQLKQALITADRSLDFALKDLVLGESMAERLKASKYLFHPQTYEKIWQSHKMRNALVHESGFEVQGFMLKASTENIRQGLKEIGLKI